MQLAMGSCLQTGDTGYDMHQRISYFGQAILSHGNMLINWKGSEKENLQSKMVLQGRIRVLYSAFKLIGQGKVMLLASSTFTMDQGSERPAPSHEHFPVLPK